jgi:predicted O-methyltransferase YrrM
MGWAEAVGPQGHVTGLEFSPEYAQIAQESFAKYGVTNAQVIIGDARES